MAKVLTAEWRNSNLTTKYPFSPRATLTNGKVQIFEGFLVDAAIYAVGLRSPSYLSRVIVTHSQATLYFGDAANSQRCSGSFLLASPPDEIDLVDAFGRPAGKLVCEPLQIAAIGSWGVGTQTFTAVQTELCGTVCFPSPEPGVRALTDDLGAQVSGDVCLVGEDGVVLTVDDEDENGVTVPTIRVHASGDPLFLRLLCEPTSLFATPRFIKTVRFVASNGSFECSPGEGGEVFIEFDDRLAAKPVVRLENLSDSLTFKTIGAKIAEG